MAFWNKKPAMPKDEVPEKPAPPPLPKDIVIVREDIISDGKERKYRADLPSGCWMECEFRSSTYSPRSGSVVLYQAKDRYVHLSGHDMVNFPNLLINPELLEPMFTAYALMVKHDKECLVAKESTQFVDKNGQIWVKAENKQQTGGGM